MTRPTLTPYERGIRLMIEAAQGNDFIRGAELSAQAMEVFRSMQSPSRLAGRQALAAWNRAVVYLRAIAAGDDGCTGAYRTAAASWVNKCATFGWEVQPPVAVECEMPR